MPLAMKNFQHFEDIATVLGREVCLSDTEVFSFLIILVSEVKMASVNNLRQECLTWNSASGSIGWEMVWFDHWILFPFMSDSVYTLQRHFVK